MCSESLPKEFEKTTELLPLSGYGLSTIDDYRRAEEDLRHIEWLKRAGLTNEEVKLYQDNEGGLLDHRALIESSVLKAKLEIIYGKISKYQREPGCSKPWKAPTEDPEITSNILDKLQKQQLSFYPEGHPMNQLKELEESLFGHLKDDALPLTKRRKIMRRLERKRERILAQEHQISFEGNAVAASVGNPGSLWDIKEVTGRSTVSSRPIRHKHDCKLMGPRNRNMYTIKDNKIVRLEPVDRDREEYRAVDIVMPVNQAEGVLLEGTKMPLEDIMKIDRFKDYEPGIPSKVLYLKNISPSVSQEQLSLLFNQFVLDNGGPIDVRLMSGRMRGQAFVSFQSENLAIQALDEVNGTILSGQPIIAQFGRNNNRIQIDENR